MNIGIDGYFIENKYSAWGNIQKYIVNNLAVVDKDDEFFVFTTKEGAKYLTKSGNLRVVLVEKKKDNFISRIKAIEKSINEEKLRIDVYLETIEIAPKLDNRIKLISIQHDFSNGSMEKTFSITKLKGIIYRRYQFLTIFRSDKILCVSEFTRNQALRVYPYPERFIVFPLGCDQIYEDYANGLIKLNNINFEIPENYFLFVGRLTVKHKNILLLLNAFFIFSKKHPEFNLVIASAEDPTREELKLINLLRNKVRIFKRLSVDDIAFLYSRAVAFIFPSIYEGFGIPIVEAQCMSCPIILNNIPVFREVSGGASLFFNGGVDDLVNAMEKVLNDEIRKSIIEKGKENCKKYSWENAAKVIYGEIHKGLEGYLNDNKN